MANDKKNDGKEAPVKKLSPEEEAEAARQQSEGQEHP